LRSPVAISFHPKTRLTSFNHSGIKSIGVPSSCVKKRKVDERQRKADEFFQSHSDYIVEILTPTVKAWCRAIDADAIEQRKLIVVLEDWSTVMAATATAEIGDIQDEKRANEVIAEWRRARATTQATALLEEIERVTQ